MDGFAADDGSEACTDRVHACVGSGGIAIVRQ